VEFLGRHPPPPPPPLSLSHLPRYCVSREVFLDDIYSTLCIEAGEGSRIIGWTYVSVGLLLCTFVTLASVLDSGLEGQTGYNESSPIAAGSYHRASFLLMEYIET